MRQHRGDAARVPALLAITPQDLIHSPEQVDWRGCVEAWARAMDSQALPAGRLRLLFRAARADWKALLESLLDPNSPAAQLSELLTEHGFGQSFSLPSHGLRTLRRVWHRLPVGLRNASSGIQLKGDPSPLQCAQARRHFPRRVLAASVHGTTQPRASKGFRDLDFVVLAPIFTPRSHQIGRTKTAKGLELLTKHRHLGVPLIALGGVESHNAGACLRAGASGLASIRTFFADPVLVEDNVAGLCASLRAAAGDDAVLAQARRA